MLGIQGNGAMSDHNTNELRQKPGRFLQDELERIVKEQRLMNQEYRITIQANNIMIDELRSELDNTHNIVANMDLKAKTATQLFNTYRNLTHEAHIDNNSLITTIESLRADLLAEQLCNKEHQSYSKKKAPKPISTTDASTQVDNALGNNSTRWAEIYDPEDLLSYDNNRELRKLNSYGITVTTQTFYVGKVTKSTQTLEKSRHKRQWLQNHFLFQPDKKL